MMQALHHRPPSKRQHKPTVLDVFLLSIRPLLLGENEYDRLNRYPKVQTPWTRRLYGLVSPFPSLQALVQELGTLPLR